MGILDDKKLIESSYKIDYRNFNEGLVSDPDTITRIAVMSLLETWHKELDVSPATITTYQRGAGMYLDWIKEQGYPNVDGATIRQWLRELKVQGYSASTINTFLAGVRSLFAWANEQGHIPYNPVAGIRGQRRKGTSTKHKRDELTENEVIGVFCSCDDSPLGKRDLALMALMAYAGLRQIECHRADVGDIQTRSNRLVLWVQGKGHTEKDDFVILNTHAEKALRAWLAVHPTGKDALFVSLSRANYGARLGLRGIRKIVKGRYKEADVLGNGKTTHSLRHSAISTAIRSGATLPQVQAMARHANINTTMIYYHEVSRTENPAEDMISYGSEMPALSGGKQ